MADTKISDLTALAAPADDDEFAVVDTDAVETKRMTWANLEAAVDHTAISNIGTNTHAQIDTHIASSAIHFTQGAITTVGTINTGVWNGTAIDGAYIDIEGTEIKSTGEAGGTKFLREDGDGTCSWQTISGGGDALTSNPLSQFAATTSAQLAGVISDETGNGALVFATSPTLVTPALGTPSSGNLSNCTNYPETDPIFNAASSAYNTHIASTAIHFTVGSISHTAITDIGTNTHSQIDTHIANTSDAHGANTTQTGMASFAQVRTTGDNASADTAFVPMVLYNTDATPPTASNFPIGTIYIQYTA